MAADDLKTKKRKGASDAAPKPKKQKKSDQVPAAAPSKPAKAPKAVAASSVSPNAKVKPSRKRAEDFFDDEVEETAQTEEKPKKKAKKTKEPVTAVAPEVEEDAPKPKDKKGKKAKPSEPTDAPAVEPEAVDEDEAAVAAVKKSKKSKKSKKQQETVVEENVETAPESAGEDDEDLDDQTAALLAGFESDRDESDLEKEDEDLDEDAPAPKLSKKHQKALQNIRKDSEPGVVYLGRIPHGFYEPQMKKYFSQFGDITRLRLSRNKKTGASKHFAFIEFRHDEVADIVAKTMHNYIMFGHILQCRVVPAEQVHPELFKGANERFKVDPRNKKAASAMKRGASREVWANRVEKENVKRAKKASKLEQEFGYTYQAPTAKPVAFVPVKAFPVAEDAEQQLLEEAPSAEVTEKVQVVETKPGQISVTETVTVKTAKKASKRKSDAEPVKDGDAENEQPAKVRVKKEKKRKSDVSADQLEESIKAPKAKKVKEEVVPEKKKKRKSDVGAEQLGESVKTQKAGKVEEEVISEKKRKTKHTELGATPKKSKKTKT